MTMPTGRALLVVAVFSAGLSAACERPAPETVESEAIVPVKTAPAVTGTIRGVVHAMGFVTPAPGGELIVVAPEAARVAAITHGEGERVRKGDVLVRFEIPSLPAEVDKQRAEVQRAQAALANAKTNQARVHDLFGRGVTARKDVEEADRAIADAEAAVVQAEASRAAASTVASRSVVLATFAGVVAKRYHNPGDVVEPSAGDPVLRVIDQNRLEVVASIPLANVARVTVGASARVTAPAAGDATLKVISRPASVDAGTTMAPVRLAFTVPTKLPAHAPVEIDIDSEEHPSVVLVPTSAIVHDGEQTALFVSKANKAERRVVQIGLSDADHVEVVSGLEAGERVIVEGQSGLPDGASITESQPDRKPRAGTAPKDEPK